MADLTDIESAQSVKIVGSDSGGEETTPLAINSDGSVNTAAEIRASQTSGFYPDPHSYEASTDQNIRVDSDNNLQTRSEVFVDAGSIRDDFSGSSLTSILTGSATFTNGSTNVVGVGTDFGSSVGKKNYIKASSAADSAFCRVLTIISDTELELESPYTGATATATITFSQWQPSTANSGTVSVANSLVTLASGTLNGGSSKITRSVDYCPLSMYVDLSISQRITNQTIIVGMASEDDEKKVQLVFDGTDISTVKFRTASSSNVNDIQETIIIIPGLLGSATRLAYQLDMTPAGAAVSINGIVKAVHRTHIPGPYDVMNAIVSTVNTAVVTATLVTVDSIFISNVDQLQVNNTFTGAPLKVQVIGAPQLNYSSFSYGTIATAAVTRVAVRKTAYTEQTVNAQRSIISSSANDSAVGTGARKVVITYYDQNLAGPFEEEITLNGTTAVNIVATNICYIEKMVVTNAGSTGSNVGIISLKAAINNGGVTIGTIAATDNQTFWAHHYVATGAVCNVTGISVSHNGTAIGSGGLFSLLAKGLSASDLVDRQVSDFIRLFGQSSTVTRTYFSPVVINGPAKLTLAVAPESSSSLTFYASMDFYEPVST